MEDVPASVFSTGGQEAMNNRIGEGLKWYRLDLMLIVLGVGLWAGDFWAAVLAFGVCDLIDNIVRAFWRDQ